VRDVIILGDDDRAYHAIDGEFEGGEVQSNGNINVDIGSTGHRKARYKWLASRRVEVCLDKRVDGGGQRCSGILGGCADIAQNRRIDTVVEASGAAIGDSTDPVVIYRLVGVENKRITLTSDWKCVRWFELKAKSC
jgi:hypothetical protein